MGDGMGIPPPPVELGNWRQDFEKAIASVNYGQVVVKIKAGQVFQVEVLESKTYEARRGAEQRG